MYARFVVCLTLGLGLLLLATSPGVAADAKSLAGTYNVSGTSPNGQKYSGTATITHKQGKVVEITWKIGKRNDVGVGHLEGDKLTVEYTGAWVDRHGKATYHVKKNGVLEGTWHDKGSGKGSETLRPAK
jgi:major membrane immunogen (membrane-anchored lipoprotein)